MPVRAEYYAAAQSHSPYYTDVAPTGAGAAGISVEPLQKIDLPAGWLTQSWSGWEGWTPRGWTPRLQGWKIHVSASPSCAAETLARTTRICVARRVAFKFLPSLAELAFSSAKQGDRGSSGKFVTIYPDDDVQFGLLLAELDEALQGQDGPYILSDLRYRDTPVFARYGGIMALFAPNERDEPVASVASGPELKLTPDQRSPRFVIPDGVELPAALQDSYERSRQTCTSRLNDFKAVVPLHFSNAGGVYKATLPDGTIRVLREARPHAGLDGRDRSAVERQLVEEQVLRDLAGVPGVQQLRGSFTAWEHRYLELDYVEGTTMTSWAVLNLALQFSDPVEYGRRAVGIAGQLIDVVQRIHDTGWAVGDLHTGNVLVGPDDVVTILDLEDACRLDGPREVGFRVFEFCADRDLTAAQADWFAVARSLMMLYIADWEIEAVAPGFWAAAVAKVGRDYGAEAAAQFAHVQAKYPAQARVVLTTDITVDVHPEPPGEDAAVEALLAGIDWSRQFSDNGAYPGDVTQPGRYRHEILGTGRAGVVLTQQRLGGTPTQADLAALASVARSWDPSESPGLYNGLAGLALVLAEVGRDDDAAAAAATALRASLGRHRLDLFAGQAGAVLAALEVGHRLQRDDLREQALAAYERLHATIEQDASALTSLTHKRGYLFGLSGVALLDLVAHVISSDPRHLGRAIERLRADLDACVRIASGELMVRDTDHNRVLPYVEWGSAGIWAIAGIAGRLAGHDLVTGSERDGLSAACSSDYYVYPSLDHGRAGILATLCGVGPRHDEQAHRQSRLLREALLHRDGMAFSIGDGLIRLSSDLSTGAAGVALALHCHRTDQPYLWLPVTARTAAEFAARPVPAGDVEADARSAVAGSSAAASTGTATVQG